MYLMRMQVIKKLLSELNYNNKTREKTSKHYINMSRKAVFSSFVSDIHSFITNVQKHFSSTTKIRVKE